MRGFNNWTDAELEILLKNRNLPLSEIAKMLPNRSERMIRERCYILRREGKLPLTNGQGVEWSKKEIAILAKNYHLPSDELLKLLPGRTKKAIQSRIFKEKESGKIDRRAKRIFRPWSKVEAKWLKENLTIDIEDKCDMLGRDKMAIFNKEKELK